MMRCTLDTEDRAETELVRAAIGGRVEGIESHVDGGLVTLPVVTLAQETGPLGWLPPRDRSNQAA